MDKVSLPQRRSVLAALAAVPLVNIVGKAGASPSPSPGAEKPLIIAHRGASGYRPEHTLEAYRLAIEMGADYIEPDLVFTKDGVLIARHDRYLSTTTNVADFPEYAERKKLVGTRQDWFTEDFTLAEIKRLRARQAFPGRSAEYDNLYEIPTFDEIIVLAKSESLRSGRKIGLYPETKAPGYFKKRGYDFASVLIDDLARNGLNEPGAPVFIQSFEKPVLRDIRARTPLPLVFLTSFSFGFRIKEISEYCDGLGPNKNLLIKNDRSSTGLLEKAHAAGLKVHPWTFRADDLGKPFASAQEEVEFFFRLGVDGVFTDFPDIAIKSRQQI